MIVKHNAGTISEWSYPLTFLRLSSKIKLLLFFFHMCFGLISSRVRQCGSHELSHTTEKQLLGPAKNFGSITNVDLLSRVMSKLFIYQKNKYNTQSYEKLPLIGGKRVGGAVHIKLHCSRSYKEETEAFSPFRSPKLHQVHKELKKASPESRVTV